MGDYGERLRDAKRKWEVAHDPKVISWAEVARQCSLLLGRKLHAETVRLMAKAKQEPNTAEFRAFGRVLEVDPGWLAFGDGDDPSERPAVYPREPAHPPPKGLQKDARQKRQGSA